MNDKVVLAIAKNIEEAMDRRVDDAIKATVFYCVKELQPGLDHTAVYLDFCKKIKAVLGTVLETKGEIK